MTYRNLNSLFRERMIELFNWNALVSYRVRCHNTFSLLKELRDVVDSWIKGYVQDFRTVGLCIEETINRVKNDNVVNFSFYEKRLFVQDLEDLQKTGEKDKDKCNRVLYLLDKCILSNKDMYLATLYSEIEKIIFRDEELPDDRFKSVADELNNLTEDLACELLNEGFSHRHLYNYSDKIELSNLKQYIDIKNTIDELKLNYDYEKHINILDRISKIEDAEYKDKINKFFLELHLANPLNDSFAKHIL